MGSPVHITWNLSEAILHRGNLLNLECSSILLRSRSCLVTAQLPIWTGNCVTKRLSPEARNWSSNTARGSGSSPLPLIATGDILRLVLNVRDGATTKKFKNRHQSIYTSHIKRDFVFFFNFLKIHASTSLVLEFGIAQKTSAKEIRVDTSYR